MILPMEERVAEVWANIFGRKQIGRHDDLFALGGHSLVAIRIANRLRADAGVDLDLRTILEHPTVASLAAELDRLSAAETPMAGSALPKISRVARVHRPGGTRFPPSTS